MYSIKEIVEQTGFSLPTLRYYEELGLLKDVPRNSSGHRCYTEEHKKRLDAIQCFKSMGMKMETLAAFFTYESDIRNYHHDILLLLEKQKADIEKQIRLQQENLEHVNQKLGYFYKVEEAIQSGEDIPSWEGYTSKQSERITNEEE